MSSEWLGACAATRRAWNHGNTLASVNPDTVDALRRALSQGTAQEIADIFTDASGQMHPGQPSRAREPWVEQGTKLVNAAMCAFLQPAVELREASAAQQAAIPKARRTRSSSEAGAPSATAGATLNFIDLDLLKDWVVHWIDHGRMPEQPPQWYVDARNSSSTHKRRRATASRNGKGAVALEVPLPQGWEVPQQIAQFLEQDVAQMPRVIKGERGKHGVKPAQVDQARMRCALVAAAAPAIESALVMTRMSESLLAVMRQTAQKMRKTSRQELDEQMQRALQASPMYRSGEDDGVVSQAFAAMASGVAGGGEHTEADAHADVAAATADAQASQARAASTAWISRPRHV